MKKQLVLGLLIGIGLMSCTKEESIPEEPAPTGNTETYVVQNLAADIGNTGHYTFYDLVNNQIVPLSDSATTKWHIAFMKTSVIVNGGTSGPGNTQALTVSGIFDELTQAPMDGYQTDNGGEKAIRGGSGNGWYNYNDQQHIITPIPGRIICVKTTEGNYVKMEVVSYYLDAPAQPEITSLSGFYTFRYAIQTDKTNQF